jgi:hypothetical protein
LSRSKLAAFYVRHGNRSQKAEMRMCGTARGDEERWKEKKREGE